MKKHSTLKFLLLVLGLILAVHIFRYSPLADQLTPGNIQSFVQGFGITGILIFILIYALGATLAVPGVALSFAGAVLYGTWLGTLVNLTGATLGASAAFFAATYLGRDFVEKLMRGKFDQFKRRVEKNGFTVILFLRLIPLFPFIGINYASGLTRIKFKDYATASFLGMIPGTFVYTYLFASVGEKILAEGFSFTDLLAPDVLIALGLFAALILATTWYRKRAQNRTHS